MKPVTKIFVWQCLYLVLLLTGSSHPIHAETSTQPPFLSSDTVLHHPPAAGMGFRTRFLNHDITIPAMDRRAINAWVAGSTINFPKPSGRRLEPLAALYFWRRPNQDRLFYADIAGLYNHLFFAQAFEKGKPLEWVTTFENYTIPFLKQTELIEGKQDKASEVEWGYVRPGFGLGFRQPVPPFREDNMAAVDFIVEPGFLYFGRHNHRKGFVKPRDTFELRTRLQVKWDALTRNFMNLVDTGFAFGADGIWGHRARWRDWGINRQERGHNSYALVTAYGVGSMRLPFADSGRHRLIGSVFGGIGHHLDRFNRNVTQRLGGGVNPVGEEFHTLGNPVLPGAAYLEFFPRHYLIAYGEYRFAATFFSFLHFYGGGAYLDPRKINNGKILREDTIMPFAGARITTGLPGKLRLVIDYAHNFGLKRRGKGYGNQVTIWVSRLF
ncbi:MAG: hypothetical protein AXA67_09955 [Methylothermaceae bacteria B42]|nr:MAG: hypothetical protein AXA67_09955 [Methylothermaceae bacteria B42]HHJ39627.1 hypothetical protein [Methylothermaceae bacterium]